MTPSDRKRDDREVGAAGGGAPDGAMLEEYALARDEELPLIFRYRTRALAAVQAYRAHQPEIPPAAVLELGAADGRTLLEIRRILGSEAAYDGLELSAELLRHAPSRLGGVRFIQGDVTDLPEEIKSRRYALVTALALLEHLEDPERCLIEARDVMSEGAVLVASCPNPVWDDLAGRFGLVRDEHHIQRMDAERMTRLLRQVGFREVRFEPFMWLPTAMLPYIRIQMGAETALRIDAWVRRLGRMTYPTFVNQLVYGVK